MDPPAGNSSSEKPHKYKYDVENTEIIHSASRKAYGTSDNTGNVFTTMSSQIIRTPPDEAQTSHINSSSNNETAQQSSRLVDNNSGCHINAGSIESPQMYKAKSSNRQNEVTSKNKVVIKVCDKSLMKQDSNHKNEMYIFKVTSVDHNVPSTSGTSQNVCDNISDNSGKKENRKRPSSLKLNMPNLDAESSSDTGNDDYSLGSEDGCIYTYRGGEHLADLPSSFFSLDMGLPLDNHLPIPPNYPMAAQAPNIREPDSRASSPDMDFLEMDFDPGPSCEVDSGDESTPDVELDPVSIMPEENEPVLRGTTPEYVPGPRHMPQPVIALQEVDNQTNVPSTSRGVEGQKIAEEAKDAQGYGPYITHVNARGEELYVHRTMSHGPLTVPGNLHISSGDLVSPREILKSEEEHTENLFSYQINQGEGSSVDSANLSLTLYHLNMAKKLIAEKPEDDPESPKMGDVEVERCVPPPRCMLWSEREACERQVTQIGTSACGATAVVNVFVALGVPVDIKLIDAAVGTRLRANNAPLPRYLLSRAVAGCTAADLVSGIQKASNGLVTARFFPTYPERAMSLSHWLADWISLGAVPILTLNLQAGCSGAVPDAWHHQMVFGVSPRGVFLCNPAGCVREEVLWPQLAAPSVLLVDTRDVVARFDPNTDLTPLMMVPDRRFHSFNVLGQVVNVIRECRARGWGEAEGAARHVRLPAAYQAGVTVAALTGTEAHRRLVHAQHLPILPPSQQR